MDTPHAVPAATKSVLVVDDELLIRDFVREILEEEGMRAHCVENADEALSYLEAHADSIDVMVTDVRMPGTMDGAELANRVAQHWPQIPIVMMSGYTPPTSAILKCKVVFLPKPWSYGQLVDAVSGVAYSTQF